MYMQLSANVLTSGDVKPDFFFTQWYNYFHEMEDDGKTCHKRQTVPCRIIIIQFPPGLIEYCYLDDMISKEIKE